LGRAFAREAFLDFRTINNGLASAAVFECWFLSERCRATDKQLINQMLSDHQGYVFEGLSPALSITPAVIGALGTMPYGKNYLAAHAATILSDTIFTDVRDRSNANFLWFIKFERSFRETEHELQGMEGPSAEDVRSSAPFIKSQEASHAHSRSADIITLFPGRSDCGDANPSQRPTVGRGGKSAGRPLSGKSKGRSSNVVYLRRWSGD
jgi:hypothetical protein